MSDQSTAVAVVQHDQYQPLMDLRQMQQQVQTIQQVMKNVMQNGEHYGTIPGCGDKPTLLQPGAQKLALTFGFSPTYNISQTDLPGGHREYRIVCRLTHRQTGGFVGEGVGCASTMEGKYRFRVAPKKPTDRPVPAAYWNLRGTDPKAAQAALGGPGFSPTKVDGVWVIAEGSGDKVEHDNPADYYNTILKMAKKRAYVDATLTATAASDIFTQDIEDMPEVIPGAQAAPQAAPQAQQQTSPPPQQQAPAQQAAPPQAQQPAPAQQTSPPADMNEIYVQDATIKEGTSKTGKPYTIYTVHSTDGRQFKTFDVNHYNVAVDCQNRQAPAIVDFKESQWGLDLKEIVAGDSGGSSQQMPDDVQTIEACIVSCEEPPRKGMIDGKPAEVRGVETSEGRFGAVGSQWGDALQPYTGTGETVLLHYQTKPQGRLILRITPLESSANVVVDQNGNVLNYDDSPF